MDDKLLDCRLDAIQELMVSLKEERKKLKKEVIELTDISTDYVHLLNPELSKLPADKIAMIVADYRKVLQKRTRAKNSIEKIDKLMRMTSQGIINPNYKPSELKKAYNIKKSKDVFMVYSDYICGDVTYKWKKLKP